MELELNLGLWHHAPPSQRRHANDISVYLMSWHLPLCLLLPVFTNIRVCSLLQHASRVLITGNDDRAGKSTRAIIIRRMSDIKRHLLELPIFVRPLLPPHSLLLLDLSHFLPRFQFPIDDLVPVTVRQE